jgi:hypothetical protein
VFCVPILGCVALLGCGSSKNGSGPGVDAGGGTDAGVDAPGATDGATDGPVAEASSCTPEAGPYDGGAYPLPTPTSIQFTAKAALPSGEQIVYNDWGVEPNTVNSLSPSGAKTEVFDVYRAWSLGVSHDGKSIAFSCGDPDQQADFGLQIGDSIQQTWIYDAASQAIRLVAHGNINDECHTFGPGDTTLWVCRRYDFEETGDGGNLMGTNKGYRIGWIDLATQDFAFLTADDSGPGIYALYPQPTADGAGFYYSTTQDLSATQTKSTLLYQPVCGGTTTTVHADARAPALSPDGTRYVYADETSAGELHVSSVDGKTDVLITHDPGTNPAWSPDGTRVAYLFYDNAAGCSHIEWVKSDGSSLGNPTRVRDCMGSGEFITQIAWFVAP